VELLFRTILQQALTACWIIPAVLLARWLLRNAPKRITNLLWLVVAFRLICPVSFESAFSLRWQVEQATHAVAELRDELSELQQPVEQPTLPLPEPDPVTPSPALPDGAVTIQPETTVTPDVIIVPNLPEDVTVTYTPNEPEITVTRRDWSALLFSAGTALWLAGAAILLFYGFFATRRWRKRVRTAVRGEDGIWRSETVESPFILGVLRPRIYLPFVLPHGAEAHVIAHEQAHLLRRDPLLKFSAFLLLSVYWFHPLVWVCYFLFCRDIELACDQQVTRDLDAEGKKAYSRALLACTAVRGDPLLCPLSFGEVGVKARIQNVLRKQPGRVFSLIALALCTALIIVCAADPLSPDEEAYHLSEKVEAAYRAKMLENLLTYGDDIVASRLVHLDEDDTPELLVLRKTQRAHTAYTYYYNDDMDSAATVGVHGGRILYSFENRALVVISDETETLLAITRKGGDKHNLTELIHMNDSYAVDGTAVSEDAFYQSWEQWESAAVAVEGDWNDLIADWRAGAFEEESQKALQSAYYEQISAFIEHQKNGVLPGFLALADLHGDHVPELLCGYENELKVYLYSAPDAVPVWTMVLENPESDGNAPYFLLDLTLGQPSVTTFTGQAESADMSTYTGGEADELTSEVLFRSHGEEYSRRLTQLELRAEKICPAEGDPQAAAAFLELLKEGKAPLYGAQGDHALYRDYLSQVVETEGAFRVDSSTDLVLGLKYAALVDFARDARPELVTLVNRRDEKTGALTFTLSVHGVEDEEVKQLYTAELGGRYGQTDLSHTFEIGQTAEGYPALISYHTQNEWTHECVQIYAPAEYENGLTLEASRPYAESFPAREELQNFFCGDEMISRADYEALLDTFQNGAYSVDVCWVSYTGSRTELEGVLNALDVSFAPVAPAEMAGSDAQKAYLAVFNTFGAVYDWQRTLEDGTEHSGIRDVRLIDFELDEVPELLIQKDKTLLLYGWDGEKAMLLWQDTFSTAEFYVNTQKLLPRVVIREEDPQAGDVKITVLSVTGGAADIHTVEQAGGRYYVDGAGVMKAKYDLEYEQAMLAYAHASSTIQDMSELVRQLNAGTAFSPAGKLLWGDGDTRLVWQKNACETCLLGDWECEDCFTSTIYLIQGEVVTKLLASVPLAKPYEVRVYDSEPGTVDLTYYIGPPHSEYSLKITGCIDLSARTFQQYKTEELRQEGNLIAFYCLPQAEETVLLQTMLAAAPEGRLPELWMDSLEDYRCELALQFADEQIWEVYFRNTADPKTIYAREMHSGQVKVLPELFWDTAELLWGYWELWPDHMVHQPRNFTLTLNGKNVTTEDTFARLDLRWEESVPTLMVDVQAAAKLLGVEVVQESNGFRTFPAGMEAYLGFSDHLVTVSCGGEVFRANTYGKPVCDDGIWYVSVYALEKLLGVGFTFDVENHGLKEEHWTLDLYDMEQLKRMAAEGAKAVGGSYTPTGDPARDRHLTKWEAVMDKGGGQALLWFNPDNPEPSNMLGPVLQELEILDRGYLRIYTSGGKTVQGFYSQPYSVPTLPAEYEEIRCVNTLLGLYSLKKDGRYGMAWIPQGWPEAQMVTDCRWPAPLTLTEMCAKVVGGEDALPVELPPYTPPMIDNSVKLLDGVLTWKGQRYPLPDWETAKSAGANGDTLEIAGDRVLVTVHINPWNSYNAVFNLETCAFEGQFYGVVLGWHQQDLTTLVYDSWGTLCLLDGREIGSYAEDEAAFRGSRVEECSFQEEGDLLLLTVSDPEGTTHTLTFDLRDAF